ncbi:MAG: LemA family protein [Acidobacteriota bacterium]|nr:LemA family protein [Acidobacteriota bacterium]
MKPLLILLGVLLIGGLLFGSKFVGVRNDLATKRETINANWSQIDTDLQRRADLIPNLVETVKGYAKEETTVVQAVSNARAGLLNAHSPQEKIDANQKLDGAIGRLLVIVENYPNLKANQNFQSLQFELAGTENRILRSRQRYNEAVQEYNTAIQIFPNNIVAGLSGFSRDDAYFKTDANSRNAPKVSF